MKKAILITLLILFSGCTSQKLKVQAGDVIEVSYAGKFLNGTIFDAGNFSFTTGAGRVIKGFDDGVLGMEENEKKTLTIPPREGYGEWNPDPIYAPFEVVNNSVYSTTGINADAGVIVFVLLNDGTEIRGLITGIENGTVTITPYKSHPLQGETLVFEVTILKITRE